jgi:hypothetical protein
MSKYRKKPVVIEACQLPKAGEDNVDDFILWADEHGLPYNSDRNEGISIETLEGTMRGDPGDWIIKGVNGEFYPCKPDIFAKTYDPVEADKMEKEISPAEFYFLIME